MKQTLGVFLLLGLFAGAAVAEPRPAVGVKAEKNWRQILANSPERLDVRWRLMRAVYYRGDFLADSTEAAGLAWTEGMELAEAGLGQLTNAGGGAAPHRLDREQQRAWVAETGLASSDVARFYFWSSIHLAAWSRTAGLLEAVRAGAANRIHAFIQVSLELEPGYDRGGPHRLLSALHASLPRVPFITGWVDPRKAIPEAERALSIDPEDPGNRFLWADTVLALRGRSPEVETIFREVARLSPRPGFDHEDTALRDAARARIEARGPG